MTGMTSLRALWAALPLAASLALAATGSAAVARDMVSIDRTEVNMRSGAGTQHEPLWLLARGYPLQVLQRKGQWLQVQDFERDKGWVYRPMTSAKKPHHVVKVNNANIRSTPSTRGRIVGKAVRGDILATQGRKGEWIKVKKDGSMTGWVASRLLWGW